MVSRVRKLAGVLAVTAWRHALLYHRAAAGVEHVPVLRQLSRCRSVVDVGANRGQFALVARYCFPNARIVSFEPLAGPARIYRAVFAHDERATLVEAAVGPHPGDAEIHLSKRDDSSSLLPITHLQTALFPGTDEVAIAAVRVVPLPEFLTGDEIEAPGLLKLDVQGYELEALRGCESLLDCFDFIYAECSFVELYSGQALADEVVAWLRERGFRLRGVHNIVYDRSARAVQGDFLFARG